MEWSRRIGAICFIGALTTAICGAQPKTSRIAKTIH